MQSRRIERSPLEACWLFSGWKVMAWVRESVVGVGKVEGPMGCVRGRGRPL